MKKTVTLLAVLLLPLLASAYEVNLEQQAALAQEFNGVITTALENQLTEEVNASEQQRRNPLYKDMVSILRNSRGVVGSAGGISTGGGGANITPAFYDTKVLKQHLAQYQSKHNTNLVQQLKNNKDVMDAVAKYIVKEEPLRNNFETLLTIGMEPVEAAVWSKKEEYVRSALETGVIRYDHYVAVTRSDFGLSSFGYSIEKDIIDDISVSEEEVNEISNRVTSYMNRRTPSFLNRTAQAISSGFEGMGRGYGHW